MNEKKIIDKETLVPISLVIAIITALFAIYGTIISDLSQVEVQAAEIQSLKHDYSKHKEQSTRYFMSISKALSRIEGKLDK